MDSINSRHFNRENNTSILNPKNCKSYALLSSGFNFLLICSMIFGITSCFILKAQEYTRGVGVYPGDAREDFSPVMVIDDTSYRNLALRRPSYHSSSYNYNLTAQLITDGIIDSTSINPIIILLY